MTFTRRELVSGLVMGSALAGCGGDSSKQKPIAAAQKAPASSVTGLLVVCHGMLLIEITTGKTMTIYFPTVPRMGTDKGHFYGANSKNSLVGLAPLGRTYFLDGPTGAASVCGIDWKSNMVLQTTAACAFKLTGKGSTAQVNMPIPDEYSGWGQIVAPGGKPLFTTTNGCIYPPSTIFETCVFHYKNANNCSLALTGQPPIWHSSDDTPSVLHLFALPIDTATPFMNHVTYMHNMFDPALQIYPVSYKDLCSYEDPSGLFGLSPSELRNLTEPVGLGAGPCQPLPGMRKAMTTVHNGQVMNCHPYFVMR